MKIPEIVSSEPLRANAGVSRLSKISFARIPQPVLLKEPTEFWNEIYIANEAYVLTGLSHPRVRHLLAYDAASHRLYLEYIEAPTLAELVQQRATLENAALAHRILQAVAETLADLHAGCFCSQPIMHNDVKSMNVLISPAPDRRISLIDFSHSYFENRLPPFITDNRNLPSGTAKYLAPEKWDGNYTHGFKGDVFAFGVLAYYVYTGQYPYDGTVAEIEQRIRETTPLSPIDLGCTAPRNIVATLMSCLEKQPQRRPTMEQIAQAYADASGLFKA